MRARYAVALLGLTVALIPPSNANEANYRHFLVGIRAAGMGGAACASATDIDACFYNPAGLARIDRDSLSVSANLYGFQKYGSVDFFYPGENLETDSFVNIPSSVGTVLKFGNGCAMAVTAFTPERFAVSEVKAFPENRHFYAQSSEAHTLWIGPSAGYLLSPKVSVGMSLFGVYRQYSRIESLYWGNYALSISQNLRASSLSFVSVLGLQYRPLDKVSIGLTVQTGSVAAGGEGEILTHYSLGMSERENSESLYAESMAAENKVPTTFSAGVSWEEPGKWALSADVTHHLSATYNSLEGSEESGQMIAILMQREPVTDFSVGAEYFFLGKYPVRAGFFSGFSSAPETSLQTSDFPAHMDLYGVTASAGTVSEHVSFNAGVSYVFGRGKGYGQSLTDGQLTTALVDAIDRELYVILSTTYRF